MTTTMSERERRQRADFRERFKTSQKGNLWQRLQGGLVLTVFQRRGGYGWSIIDTNDKPHYGRRDYPTAEDAIEGLYLQISRMEDGCRRGLSDETIWQQVG
jgi:hypothetical protein